MIVDCSSFSDFGSDRDDYFGSAGDSGDEFIRLRVERKQKNLMDALRNRD